MLVALERLGERGGAPIDRLPGPPDEELRAAAARLEDIFRIRPQGRIGGPG